MTRSTGDRLRASIGGVGIDPYDFATVVRAIVDRVRERNEFAFVVTPNAQHVVTLQYDERFRAIYERAFLVVPDGVPLLWAAKMLGQRLGGRVNGTDLLETLCAVAARERLRVFFLGGRVGAAAGAAAVLRRRYPDLDVCGTYCPSLGFERDPVERAKIVATINAAHPDLLFVGLGAPKQEYWIDDNAGRLNVGVALGIGVSFEFVAGLVARAPRWMQTYGLEWLFRLVSEPKRLWRRYLVGNVLFCAIVARQWLAERRRS